ncbi:sigma-70 family RNA polymerase sigma factor [Paenibacillus ginsengarvi]|uniref:Sigma-70 family RNA polymerase sigma factor n=1 Tax=Paenibacillus ginsengarvi TaxID=400777 RepID=A0A3B0BEX9_9BACL|nr:sigma-70 family RNA polymerase sigma factor [Paenibacillus ginsengarvi]RKN71202.1 sigma-70 family RNA polymerase sigma factor [Paenibacillus ginsengarvi]
MEVVHPAADRYLDKADKPDRLMSKEDFAHMFDLYHKRVYKYICYRIHHHYAAEDLCSQVFETVICKYDRYSPEKAAFEVWLFAIVRNVVTDYYRTQKKRALFSLDALRDLVMSKHSPEEQAIRDDNHRELFKALSKLREKERHLVAMKFGAGLKNAEIAELLGISESNAGVVLHRSLKKLQKTLEAGGVNYE